jgi:hypothetical protein
MLMALMHRFGLCQAQEQILARATNSGDTSTVTLAFRYNFVMFFGDVGSRHSWSIVRKTNLALRVAKDDTASAANPAG